MYASVLLEVESHSLWNKQGLVSGSPPDGDVGCLVGYIIGFLLMVYFCIAKAEFIHWKLTLISPCSPQIQSPILLNYPDLLCFSRVVWNWTFIWTFIISKYLSSMCSSAEKESTFPEFKHSAVAKLYSSYPKIETITSYLVVSTISCLIIYFCFSSAFSQIRKPLIYSDWRSS